MPKPAPKGKAGSLLTRKFAGIPGWAILVAGAGVAYFLFLRKGSPAGEGGCPGGTIDDGSGMCIPVESSGFSNGFGGPGGGGNLPPISGGSGCPEGTFADDSGNCIPVTGGGDGPLCPPGQIEQDGGCVSPEPPPGDDPSNPHIGPPPQVTVCAPGLVLKNGRCVPEPPAKFRRCPPGQIFKNGRCRPRAESPLRSGLSTAFPYAAGTDDGYPLVAPSVTMAGGVTSPPPISSAYAGRSTGLPVVHPGEHASRTQPPPYTQAA